ncbi:hypothetical protein JW868_01410 [Candidatus Woesearchaeota archaeon]|nr:hypothetical protein [Candidatus Woesearchaeota archaeon]
MSEDYEKIKKRVKKRLNQEFRDDDEAYDPVSTREYDEFKKDFLPTHLTFYEKACNLSETVLRLSPDKKKLPQMIRDIETCHLNITPTGAYSFAILGPMLFIIFGALLGYGLPILLGLQPTIFFVMVVVMGGFVMMIPLQKLPQFFADTWRMRASNQMVLCVFYMVTYMRHSSNLEKAVEFAASHLGPPLALDLKMVLWELETQKHDSIKEGLDEYLKNWRGYNQEFIEAIHLLESSLYELSEDRRVNALEKSLSVMLEETYEKMLHYAHNLKGPITTLHMMGIVLPILGLVILPLVVSFLEEVKWYHISMLYNVITPITVYYMGKTILAKRPSGYGETEIAEYEQKKKSTAGPIMIFILFILIAAIPIIFHYADPNFDIVYDGESFVLLSDLDPAQKPVYSFLGYEYRSDTSGNAVGQKIGPFGLGATILSLAAPLSVGLGLGYYYKNKSSDVIKVRNKTKELEKEFASALFQLGNRLGDGIPAELAFSRVSELMEDTTSGRFFDMVSINIQKLGMSVSQAVFDKKIGAIKSFPSNLIESSMKVLIQSARKGPKIASQAVINVSNYIKEMHRVEERLKDLMADVMASMEAQIAFLAPTIAGIVVGITSMITRIIGSVSSKIREIATANPEGGYGALLTMMDLGLPTYHFQIIVGIYVVQIVFILTILVNGIQNGSDKISESYLLGKNLIRSTLLYVIISLLIMVLFNIIAGNVISGGESTF